MKQFLFILAASVCVGFTVGLQCSSCTSKTSLECVDSNCTVSDKGFCANMTVSDSTGAKAVTKYCLTTGTDPIGCNDKTITTDSGAKQQRICICNSGDYCNGIKPPTKGGNNLQPLSLLLLIMAVTVGCAV